MAGDKAIVGAPCGEKCLCWGLWDGGRSDGRGRSGIAGAAKGGLVGYTEGASNRLLGTSA